MNLLLKKLRPQKGQGLIEYVALTALIAIVCISTIRIFGSKVKTRLNQVTKTFDQNITSGYRNGSRNQSPPPIDAIQKSLSEHEDNEE